MERRPIIDQAIERERRLGFLTVGLGTDAQALDTRVDTLRNLPEPDPRRLAGSVHWTMNILARVVTRTPSPGQPLSNTSRSFCPAGTVRAVITRSEKRCMP
jgi:hypothetical protein